MKLRPLCGGCRFPIARVPGSIHAGRCKRNSSSVQGEEKTVILVLGQADDAEHARRLIARYRDRRNRRTGARRDTRSGGISLLTTIQVQTPVLSVDLMMNRWLLYQSLSCRIWGRSALYQSSGAYGFRDQLQDALAFVYSAPDIAREMILHAASRQFVEGDVQHWWHLPSGEGVRTPVLGRSAVASVRGVPYVEVTGDTDILDATATFPRGTAVEGG